MNIVNNKVLTLNSIECVKYQLQQMAMQYSKS